MTKSTVLFGTVFAAAAFSVSALAADAGHGRELAQRWCAECHVVAAGQGRASTDVPPFSEIAKRSDFDSGRLARFLLEPHPKMPNMALSRRDADDITAYIATLK
jgi:mono/diheme cytochrome c family protein